MNSSVCGPFLPSYYKNRWIDPFIELFEENVKMAGATINILNKLTIHSFKFKEKYNIELPHTHVQTMFFGLDKEALFFLMKENFFNRDVGFDKDYVIINFEILLSQLILKKGWNISCILPEYKGIDYRKLTDDFNPTSRNGDVIWPESYFG